MNIVRSNNSVMASTVNLKWEGEEDISLPGVGIYSSFDFYVDGEILPFVLTGLEAK